MFCFLALVPLLKSQLSYDDPDSVAAVVYDGSVRGSQYLFVIGAGPVEPRIMMIQPGNRALAKPTQVNGKPALGMLQPWDLPRTRITAFVWKVNGKVIPIDATAWQDVFNISLRPVGGGTSPPTGSLLVYGDQSSGDLLIEAHPLPELADHPLKLGTDSDVYWRINTAGRVQREIRMRGASQVFRLGPLTKWDFPNGAVMLNETIVRRY